VLAGADAASDAELTILMLRELLRWRARCQGEAQGAEGSEVALEKAEAAARILHQLFTISRSWGSLSRWSAGVRKNAVPL
jgi:hypothetical protein